MRNLGGVCEINYRFFLLLIMGLIFFSLLRTMSPISPSYFEGTHIFALLIIPLYYFAELARR